MPRTMPCAVCKEPMHKGRTSQPEGIAAHNACRKLRNIEQSETPCADCGKGFSGSRRGKVCGPCRYERAKANAKTACTMCERPATAKGLCLTHYSNEYRAKYGRKRPAYPKTCEQCSTPFTTTTKRTVFCSLSCAQRSRAGTSTDVVLRLRPRVWIGSKQEPRAGKPMVAGQCSYCPTYFVGVPGSKYCSDQCSNNASWKRRYERRGEFKVTDKQRLAVYERDNYECQLCYGPVDTALHYNDRMSATLDHIIPQSHMLIPDHSVKNLRLAHRLCNSIRGDRIAA